MGKHARKRQKTSKEAPIPLGLNTLTDELSKDDEERRLESLLFGTKFVSRNEEDEEDQLQVEGGGREMQNLTDTDLFFLDDGVPPTVPHPDVDVDQDDEDDHDDEGDAHPNSQPQPSFPLPLKSRQPAWTDPSDPPQISLSPSRLRKLRDAPSESTLPAAEYETRLRRQYQRIHPEPAWAARAKRRRSSRASEFDDSDVEDMESGEVDMSPLFSSTSGILAPSGRKSRVSTVLPSRTLAIERLRDANQAVQASGGGEIKVVAFHPSQQVPVLCVGSADRRVRLFNIDGHTSPLLQTLHIPSLPLISPTSASFHPSGTSLLLTGPRPFFFVYDLQSGAVLRKALRPPPNRTNTSPSTTPAEGMETTAFSPTTGEILAVGGRGGYVHLVDWKSGAGQVVGSLKCGGWGGGTGAGGVKALWWVPPGVEGRGGEGRGREHLAVLTGDAEVYLWDVGERRCVRRWRDEGGFRGAGRAMAGSAAGASGGWLGVGSNTGLVNVYGSDSFAVPSGSSTFSSSTNRNPNAPPKPIKTIANLTTAISTLKFNHDAQLLAVASKEKKDAMRLIHLPTLTSFANWPTSSTPLGHVTTVDFSAGSEYVAIGNTRGRVLLYHLKDYGAGR